MARVDRPVLIAGERGTGKRMMVERLHRLSPRWDGPLASVACATMAIDAVERTLFGGPGAPPGAIERADKGTLFLDAVEALPMPVQARLLQCMERGAVGGLRVDMRVVATTGVDLPAAAARGAFDPGLLDALAFEVVTVPPLRARGADIVLLAEYFGRRMATELGWGSWPGFAHGIAATLTEHDWPSNIRELRAAIERAVARWDDPDAPVAKVPLDPFASPWRVEPPVDASPPPAQPPEPPSATRGRPARRDGGARTPHPGNHAGRPPLEPPPHGRCAVAVLRPAAPRDQAAWAGGGLARPRRPAHGGE